MSRYGGSYRRARPKISFALATCFLLALALAMTGVLGITVDMDALNANPRAAMIGIVFVVLAAMLLYEW